MQLSILLPTHRRGSAAVSRVAQASSWARPEIEVIIRDNSGDAKKRELVRQFNNDYCNVIVVDPCEPLENTSEILRLAKGDFIFVVGDDDLCFDRAIEAMPGVLEQFGKDPSVVGVTGLYALETSKGSAIYSYPDVGSDDVVARVTGFLSNVPNVFYYSILRREMVERILAFMRTMPIFLSFHDQIICLLYLLCGKFIQLPRLLYAYDVGVWEFFESAQKRDIDFYKAAGLDPAVNKLHWLLCGFEGAVLIRNSVLFPDYPLNQRQLMADRWFSLNFLRFRGQDRPIGESRFAGDAQKLCAKLDTSMGQLSFQDMLTEICGLFALFAQGKAQRYHDFWDAQINRRASATTNVGAAAAGGAI